MFTYAILLVLPALIVADLESDLFKVADKDADGKITQPEAEGYFLGYDTNKDGTINLAEFTTNVDKVNAGFATHEAALFKLLDQNSDGKVDKGDLDATFKIVDTNADGNINKQEFAVVFAVITHV